MGKSSFFVFATATRNEPATARLFSTLFTWTSVQIFRVLGMSCAVFLWNFFLFRNLSKCFRPDLRLRFEGWPGAFSIHLFRIQVQYLESSNAIGRLTEELFLPGWSFFRSLRTFGKPRPRRAWFSPPASTAQPSPPPFPCSRFFMEETDHKPQPCKITDMCGVGALHLELPRISILPTVGIHPDGPRSASLLHLAIRLDWPSALSSSAAARRVPALTAVMSSTPAPARYQKGGGAKCLQVTIHPDPTASFQARFHSNLPPAGSDEQYPAVVMSVRDITLRPIPATENAKAMV